MFVRRKNMKWLKDFLNNLILIKNTFPFLIKDRFIEKPRILKTSESYYVLDPETKKVFHIDDC